MKIFFKKDVSDDSYSCCPHNVIYDNGSIFFNVVSCGFEKIQKNYYLKRSEFFGNMLTYIVDGRGTLIFKNKKYDLQKDDLILINCMEEQILYPCSKGMTIYYMHIDSNIMANFANDMANKYSVVFPCADKPQILEMFKNIVKKDLTSIDNLVMSKQLYELLLELRLKTLESSRNSIDDPEPLKEVIRFIREHFSDSDLSLEVIAKHANFNKFYLEKLFHKYLNTTVHIYLTNIRLTNARYLLLSTNLSVTEISYKSGFSEPQVLVKCFKRYYNETPLQFRKKRTIIRNSL